MRMALCLSGCALLLNACLAYRQTTKHGMMDQTKAPPGWHSNFRIRADDEATERRTGRIRWIRVRDPLRRTAPASAERVPEQARMLPPNVEDHDPEPRTARERISAHSSVVTTRPADALPPTQEDLMPKKEWNKLAIPVFALGMGSMAVGLLTTSTAAALGVAVAAVVLGAIALKHIRAKDQAGKGFALIGFILGIFALFFTAIVLVVGA